MGVHASGDGAAWGVLEDLDVDQPHGLDYRESVHTAKAVRKRLSQEHSLFADATVGGVHTPGGTGALMLDSTADMDTFAAAADLTSAHAFGMACNTAPDPTGATMFFFDDATEATTWPVSWNNILTDITHSFGTRSEITIGVPVIFEQSVAINGDVSFDGDVGIGGDLSVDGTADFAGDAAFAADVSIDASVVCGAGFLVEGTAVFTTNVDVSGTIDVSGTLNVASYNADISGHVTLPADVVMKWGMIDDIPANNGVDFTYKTTEHGGAYTTTYTVLITELDETAAGQFLGLQSVADVSPDGFSVANAADATVRVYFSTLGK